MLGALASALEDLGGLVRLLGSAARAASRRPFEWGGWLDQIQRLGAGSLTVASLTTLFTGMVLAVQTTHTLSAYGGRAFVADIVSLAVVRELGPVLTAIMVAGRVGAGVTAELGSMVVTEQIDAMRAMAVDPLRKLVAPRLGALLIALPLLTVIADAMGLCGGMLLAMAEAGQSGPYFMGRVVAALRVQDIASGLGKSFFFAIIIGGVACHNGLRVSGGADGVGRATTRTVVGASIAVIVSDFFLTKLFLAL